MLGCCLFAVELAHGETELTFSELYRTSANATEATSLDQIRGNQWGLKKDELNRANLLLKETRQYISDKQITPIEVLGIHARSDEERERYARLWAEFMLADANRILQFQQAYDVAMRELVSNQPLIELAKLPPRRSHLPSVVQTDRLVVFISIGCDRCSFVIDKVLNALDLVAGIDFYFKGLTEQDAPQMRQWALQQRINPRLVQSKKITLNPDNGLLAQVNPRAIQLPVLMKRQEDRFTSLDFTDLP